MNKRGVTLIELVIVFVIIAIGAVLITPNIGPWMQNYRLRSSTRDIVSNLRTAQMKAVSTNVEHRVSFDAGGKEYLLQVRTTQSAPNDWSPTWENARAQVLQQTLPKGIEIVGGAVFNAEFNPNSTASAGTVRLRNTKGTERTISVLSTTGRITVN